MNNKIKRYYTLLKSKPLVKSFLILVSGTGVAQLFPIISAPIVARLYDPIHFGEYAIFYSIVTLLTGLAFLDYHHVIIIEKSMKKSFYGLILSFGVCLGISIATLILIFIIPDTYIVNYLGVEVTPFLWILPITVLLNGISTLLYMWFLRRANFSLIAKNKIILGLSAICLQIGIGFLKIGSLGFIIANLGSLLISIILFGIVFFKQIDYSLFKINYIIVKKLAKEYKKFPTVSVWSNSLNIATLQLPQLILNGVFGGYVGGQFSLANRMISLPLSFVSSAVQDIFRQSASAENAANGNCKKSFINILKIGIVIGGIVFLACITFVPSLFVFVFGNKWAEAGDYVRVLAILITVRFFAGPLSYTFYIKMKQRLDFLWQIGLFIFTIFTLYFGYYGFGIENPVRLLLFYSVVLTFWYIVNVFITYNLAMGKEKWFKRKKKNR